MMAAHCSSLPSFRGQRFNAEQAELLLTAVKNNTALKSLKYVPPLVCLDMALTSPPSPLPPPPFP